MRAVNLIPQDQRRRVAGEGDGKSAPIVLGVLGALLALVVVYVMTGNTVTHRQSDAKAASAAADQLEARAGKQTSYTNFAQIAATRMESVSGSPPLRFDWERFMRELVVHHARGQLAAVGGRFGARRPDLDRDQHARSGGRRGRRHGGRPPPT